MAATEFKDNVLFSGTATFATTVTAAEEDFAVPADLTVGDDATIAGDLVFSAASAKIIPGATSLLIRNAADDASNIAITNAGAVTVRAGLTVTAGGATITAGNLTVTDGFVLQEVAASVSAAGSAIADATALAASVNAVTTVESGTGVKLPVAAVGATIVVQNLGANDLAVYPPDASGAINGGSAGDPLTLVAATDDVGTFIKIGTNAWIGYIVAGTPA